MRPLVLTKLQSNLAGIPRAFVTPAADVLADGATGGGAARLCFAERAS